jgi:hypothetical protein
MWGPTHLALEERQMRYPTNIDIKHDQTTKIPPSEIDHPETTGLRLAVPDKFFGRALQTFKFRFIVNATHQSNKVLRTAACCLFKASQKIKTFIELQPRN